jgi:hypothetical protein
VTATSSVTEGSSEISNCTATASPPSSRMASRCPQGPRCARRRFTASIWALAS